MAATVDMKALQGSIFQGIKALNMQIDEMGGPQRLTSQCFQAVDRAINDQDFGELSDRDRRKITDLSVDHLQRLERLAAQGRMPFWKAQFYHAVHPGTPIVVRP